MSNAKTGGGGSLDCYDFYFLGRPDKIGDPYLWVDAGDKGVVFDNSGDDVPSDWSDGTAPGYNFGLPAWSTDFSGSVRTLFDKSGHNHHLMNSLNQGYIVYSEGSTDFVYQSNAAVIKVNDGSSKLYHLLENGDDYVENFDFSFVFTAPEENTARYGTLFSSRCGTEDSLNTNSWQICGGNPTLGTTYDTLLFRQNVNTTDYASDIVLEVDAIGLQKKRVLRLKKTGDTLEIYLERTLIFSGTGFDDMRIGALAFFVNRQGNAGIPGIQLHESVLYYDNLSASDYNLLYSYYACKWLSIETVLDYNNPPIATDDTYSCDSDSSVIMSVLGNDTDADTSDTLSVTGIDTTGTVGQITINGDGTLTYTADGFFDDLAEGETTTDTFSYTVSDGEYTDTATVTITITGAAANNAPVCTAQYVYCGSLSSVEVSILANCTDADGDTLTITSVNTSGTTGSVTDNGDGTVTYSAAGAFTSLAEGEKAYTAFTCTVTDGTASTFAVVTVEVTGEVSNTAPVAEDDTDFGVTAGQTLTISDYELLTNDTDADGDTLTITSISVQSGSVGTLTDNGDGTYNFYVSMNEVPSSTTTAYLEYTVSDGNGGEDTGVVEITVYPAS